MAEPGDTKGLADLTGLDESDILSMPEENLPASLLPEFLVRREEALQKKEAADAGDEQFRQTSQDREKDQSALDDERSRMSAEAYESEMRDIYEREDVLLENLDREEARDQEELSKIDSRALKLRDGRLAYVGENGTYVDQHGQTLQGQDDADARAQNQLHPDAATWAERSDAEKKLDGTLQMRQDVLDMQAQQKKEDSGNLSGEQMATNLGSRSATVSRFETEYAEELQSRSATVQKTETSITNSTYGGDDYMAAYGGSGASLMSSFGRAADPSAASGSNPNAKLQAQSTSAPALALTR